MNEGQEINRRVEFIYFVCIIVLAAFVVRLFCLQVIQYSFYKKHAERQQSETIKQQIGRGTIYTSDNKKAAVSIKAFAISADPSQVKNKLAVAEFLSGQIGVSRAEIGRA